MRTLLAGTLLSFATAAHAQAIDVAPPKSKAHVAYLAEDQAVAAGRPATLTLRFQVENGFHINSHTPKSDLLIPTKLAVEDLANVDVKAVDFPTGKPYSFAFDPKEKLDVYTGDFALTAHLTAKPGTYTLKALLRYQACDNAACYPPKMLPVEAHFTAK